MGRLLLALLGVVVVALVITMAFQVHSILTTESGIRAADTSAADLGGLPTTSSEGGSVAEPESESVDTEIPVVPARAQKEKPAADIPEAQPSKLAIGRVLLAVGEVASRGVDDSEESLRVDSTIYMNDTIICGASSKAKISLDDGTVLWLGEMSELVIDEYTYQPQSREDNNSVIRFVKGVCRIVTGAITSLNPDGFRVRMRVATVGIRGCETGFESDDQKGTIYVLGLGEDESLVIETAIDGVPVMNMESGEVIDLGADRMRTVNVDEPGFSVSVTVGKGVAVRRMETDEIQQFMRLTSHLPPATYDLHQKSDGAVVVIRPQSGATSQGQNTSQ